MKKKTILIVICLIVLIIPTSIFAGKKVGCPGHVFAKRTVTESLGNCQYQNTEISYCTNPECNYEYNSGGSAKYYNHKCKTHVSLGPNSCLHYCKCGKYKYADPAVHWFKYQN